MAFYVLLFHRIIEAIQPMKSSSQHFNQHTRHEAVKLKESLTEGLLSDFEAYL